MVNNIINHDCLQFLQDYQGRSFDITFFDPPFNQNKEYNSYDDAKNPHLYWNWITKILKLISNNTTTGGAIYFMQREKNTKLVMDSLEKSGWRYQNLIIWKKKTSAVPGKKRFGKHYQIIAFYTKGDRPRLFNRLRIDPPLKPNEKIPRESGVYLTDVWDDIRELTSGYYAGDEAYRNSDGSRFHKQQTPISLLTRIILSSSLPGDIVFDPFAGTGTTLIVSKQLQRDYLGLEIDSTNIKLILSRLSIIRKSDNISKIREIYKYTNNLIDIWSIEKEFKERKFVTQSSANLNLFTRN
ncbi:site-specific DNA-methyltransferase [bacterium]|nr:site-specific DNA-methyltransferase [bacterium]